MNQRHAVLILVSGPSGSGKTTLCQTAERERALYYTVSCTTRAMRPGEVRGDDYFFLSQADFAERLARGEFLEHATVHGRSYGTLVSEVLPRLHNGQDVIMDLDPQGAAQLRACQHPDIRAALVDVFILPPAAEAFRQRLAARHSESAEELELRVANAREEIGHWREYRYAIVSGTREADFAALSSIITAEQHRSERLLNAEADSL